ncbi:MAG: phage portal protein [Tannerella sp.]|jgi:SPP1 family phage portal protein|nr:phage portal protein [Tannerella sp.]
MDIHQLLAGEDTGALIAELKSGRKSGEPKTEVYAAQLNPSLHDVNDPGKRPDKRVRTDLPERPGQTVRVTSGGEDEPDGNTRTEKVARIALALQKLIVKRAVAFTFGNPVRLNAEPKGDDEKTVLKAVKRILFDTKGRTLNRRVAREIFSTTEAAEFWYPVVNAHESYGFHSGYKLRAAVFGPSNGDKLYPYFDETGDMAAFSREFTRTDRSGVSHLYFETYTDRDIRLWINRNGRWETAEGYPVRNVTGKIPIVYGCQPAVEWEDVQSLIDRLEKLLSNFADTNDYHASPKIVVKGEVTGFSKKGETGAILQLEGDNPDARYLSWEHAPESVKLEIDTLLRMIYTVTQTPDISFDSVKGLGALSGVALKLLFMDAHLKVQEKMEIFDDFLQRRLSIIQAYVGQFDTKLQNACRRLTVEPEITPYMIEDEQAAVSLLMDANGNRPVASQRLTVQRLGWAEDAEMECRQIAEETELHAYRDAFNPTM